MILEIRNSAIFCVAVMGLMLAGEVQAASGDGGGMPLKPRARSWSS